MWLPERCPTTQVEDGARLWRYVDLTRMLALCAHRRLHFAPANSFDDAKEGQLLAAEREAALRELRVHSAGPRAVGGKDLSALLRTYLERATEQTFISSWTLAENESWLHWNRFGLLNTVALQTTVGALRRQLAAVEHEVVPGPVEYTDACFARVTAEGEARFFRKRRCFAEEHEYRLVVALRPGSLADAPQGEEDAHDASCQGGLFVPVDLEAVLEQVVVSPGTPRWGLHAIAATLRALGYSGVVSPSQTI